MSNLSSLANVSIAKDKYIARLQQRMPMAIQALAATIATRASSSSSDTSSTRRDEEWSLVNSGPTVAAVQAVVVWEAASVLR